MTKRPTEMTAEGAGPILEGKGGLSSQKLESRYQQGHTEPTPHPPWADSSRPHTLAPWGHSPCLPGSAQQQYVFLQSPIPGAGQCWGAVLGRVGAKQPELWPLPAILVSPPTEVCPRSLSYQSPCVLGGRGHMSVALIWGTGIPSLLQPPNVC